MRRAFTFYLTIVLCLGLFGGFAWLTRHPDAEILSQARDWPWVGPLASRFRQAYSQRDARPSRGAPEVETRPDRSIAAEPAPAEMRPRPYRRLVWILGGEELKSLPSAAAATLHTFDQLARAERIERRGDWYRVDYNGRVGWVLLEGYDEDAEIPYGEAPEPPRPLPARAPGQEALAAAREYLGGRERIAALGPYTLYTDSRDDALIAQLDSVAGRLEALYAERYGRVPVGVPAEAVVLLQSDIAYRLIQRRSDRLAGIHSAGHNAEGIAVLYVGGRSRAAVAGTLIHELVHFLNRRALGPQLPPWLDEGIADDLGLSRVEADGVVHPRELGGVRQQRDGGWLLDGALASLVRLRAAARDGTLPRVRDLIGADWDSFVRAPGSRLRYAAAAFWVRYLVDGEGGRRAAGFRDFLDAVAAGAAPAADTLQTHLGEPWSVLDASFRAWIETLALSAGLEATEDSRKPSTEDVHGQSSDEGAR